MTSSLRCTGTFARLSHRGGDLASKQPLSSRCLFRQQRPAFEASASRGFASRSKKPDDSKGIDPDGHKVSRSSKSPKDGPVPEPGRSAPGMEHMYNRQSPLNSHNTSSPPQKEQSQPSEAPKASRNSPEDEEALDELASMVKRTMPKMQAHDFDRAIQAVKKEGMPQELREVLETYRGKRSFDLSMAAKVIRITSQLGRRAAEIHLKEERDAKSGGEQKSGPHDPGPKDGSKGKKKGSDNEFQFPGIGSIRLDTGTVLSSAFVSYMVYRSMFPTENSKDITWQEFRTQFFDRGLVQRLTVINRNRVRVTLDRDAVRSYYPDSPAANSNFSFYFSIGDVATFERHLDEAHSELGIPSSQRIPISYQDETPWLPIFLSYLPTLLLLGLPIYFLRRGSSGLGGGNSGGLFGMGRSKAKKFNHETDVKVTFKDVAGMDEAKQEITEFVSFLKEPGLYQKLGAKIPRGAMLSGPPGTGKTMLARATAGESSVPFFSVSGSEFVEMFVGVGASRVRDLFATARKSTPCIIFIDEIDAIGKKRGQGIGGGGNDEREATLNQILTEMDGFSSQEQVVVMAGTNRSDVLDQALLRPGRFDRHIYIDRPTMEGRKEIFGVYIKKVITKEVPEHLQGRLAALTPGFSGADIANCVNEAALIAARNKADDVTMTHFEAAIERIIGGLEKKSLVLNPQEKKTVAYHEAGHAICGWFFKYADPLLKVSIIPRGQGALGYAQYLPAGDSYLMNVNQLMDRMAMTLAGRVSEELHFDTVTSGASDDFNKVTRMATAMVTKFGMSDKIGYLYFDDDSQQQLHKPFSEETAKNIDLEVRRIVHEAYKQCKDLLVEKKREIGVVAEELLHKEVLSRDDMIRLIGPRPFKDSDNDFTKYFGSRGDREGAPDPKPGESGSTPGEGGGPALPGGIGGPAPAFRRVD